MIHQPSGGAGGQTSDISIAAKEILRAGDKPLTRYSHSIVVNQLSNLRKIPTETITCLPTKLKTMGWSMK